MKIIFDNEEQKEKFIDQLRVNCPEDYGLPQVKLTCSLDCVDCWNGCGIECEVKEKGVLT